MLNLSAIGSPNSTDNSNKRTSIQLVGTLSGNYTTGGEPVVWTGLSNVNGGSVIIASSKPNMPLFVEIFMSEPSATSPILILAVYNYATSKIQIYTSEGTELAAGAYSESYTGAQLMVRAEFIAN